MGIFRALTALQLIGVAVLSTSIASTSGKSVEVSMDEFRDRIRRGTLGHMLGDLNGLKHKMKYIVFGYPVATFVQ